MVYDNWNINCYCWNSDLFNFLIFVLISLISRGLRFFLVSYLSYKFGDLFNEFMDKHGSKWFTIIGILIVIVGIVVYLIFKSDV